MPPGARPKVEHAIKIEHHHEPVVKPMNAGRGLRELEFEVDRILLPAAGRQFQDFADGIDQQSVGFAIVLDADGKRTPAVAGRPESKPAPHVDHRQDAPTHVEEARHLGWGKRYPGQTIRNEHVLYPRNRQAEQLAADRCSDVFHEGFHRDHALRAHLASAACALSAASRPQRSNLATQSRSLTLLPRSMASGESMDDNPTIGSCAVDGFARNADARSKPSIPGISMLVITNWKRSPDSRTASASPADAAVVTAYPAALTTGASMLRKNGESSIRSARRSALSSPGSLRLRQSPKASGRKCPMSMISVACPFITADPSKPAFSLISSISRRSCTISTISSTTSPMARCSSENTSRACVPLLLIFASGAAGTSGMSWPRYCTTGRPFRCSMVLASISSNRVTRESGTAFGLGDPARKTSMDSVAGCSRCDPRSRGSGDCVVCGIPTAWATPLGSRIRITEPSPRMVLPPNTEIRRSLLDIGFTTISSVSETPSTRSPKLWLPTCITTTKPRSAAGSRPPPIASSARS